MIEIELCVEFIEGKAGAVYAVEKPTAHDPNDIVSDAKTCNIKRKTRYGRSCKHMLLLRYFNVQYKQTYEWSSFISTITF